MNVDDETRDYFRKLKIAEKFSDGDTETAKSILRGERKDLVVIKGRFKNEEGTIYGLFVVFISSILKKVLGKYASVSIDASVYSHKPYDSWKGFLEAIKRENKEARIDEEKQKRLEKVLCRLDELKMFDSFFGLIGSNDIQALTADFAIVLNKSLGENSVQTVIDYENTTSIAAFEEKAITLID